MYRQGDVALFPVDTIPTACKAQAPDSEGVILARGEQTGHHHRFEDSSIATILVDPKDADNRFLQLNGIAPLVHEEHAPIEVAPGTYRILRKREYQAADAPPRWVSD